MLSFVIRVTHAPSPIAWWSRAVGQVSQVLDVYEPTGYMKIRLMFPTYWETAIDSHYQVEGWIDPGFVEVITNGR